MGLCIRHPRTDSFRPVVAQASETVNRPDRSARDWTHQVALEDERLSFPGAKISGFGQPEYLQINTIRMLCEAILSIRGDDMLFAG